MIRAYSRFLGLSGAADSAIFTLCFRLQGRAAA